MPAVYPFPLRVPKHPAGEPPPTCGADYAGQLRTFVDVPGYSDGIYRCDAGRSRWERHAHLSAGIVRGEVSDALWDARLEDFDAGERGPLFIWGNPSPDNPAGQNAGLQIWIGDNPTATPGADHTVGQTIFVVNGYDREHMYGLDVAVVNGDLGDGWLDGHLTGIEIEIQNGFAATQTNPWGPGNRKNGLELTGTDGSVGRLSAAMEVWANDTSGDKWWTYGIGLSRISDIGLWLTKHPNGIDALDEIDAFGVAGIYDDSNSLVSYKITGDHVFGIDMAGAVFSIGAIRLANQSWITELNLAGDDQLQIVRLNAGDQTEFGNAIYAIPLVDGVTAPTAVAGKAFLYVDTADGDLKVRFGDNTTKTIATDT